ncbi:hypothetical protein K461DRAFT_279565 [Myriangium duriaei CBS 260.36]|uniref:Uncharacterized protein n=1 Tax=Myriangium duriaei CBS 260.36 TaxID=1168546 RepID=A0A9P4IY48_9PEZI|nr:hypothetical protein K461DRAFT_279565 [Myriangium duriaei CBS 260.36]
MDLDSESTVTTALLIFLETTLYVAYLQLAKKNRRRNCYLFVVLALHLSQRRVVFNDLDRRSVFGWAVIHLNSNNQPEQPPIDSPLETIDGTILPPGPPHPLNVTNAISLHNRLVSHVLTHLPHLSHRVHKDWFSLHTDLSDGPTGASVLPRLSPDVVLFLTSIYVWPDLATFSLTPHARGVAWPDFLSPDPASLEGELFYETMPNCIVLYHSSVADSEARGLVLDQRTNLARWMPTMWDDARGRPWAPLEDVLASWVENAESGRWTVDPSREGGDPWGPPTAWCHERWIERDVDRTVSVWEAYLALLAAKMGRPLPPVAVMASDKLLDAANVTGFERLLLSRLRRPGFAFVAPGLRIPDETMFARTLEESSRRRVAAEADPDVEVDEVFMHYAVLLFYADAGVANRTYRPLDERHTARHWMEHFVLDDRCGVYLVTWYSDQYADAVSVVAPRTQGNRTEVLFEQYSGLVEGSLLNRENERLAEAAGGYQPLRLYHMIARWYDMVVSGKWKVGPEGIEGSPEDVWDMMPGDWRYN